MQLRPLASDKRKASTDCLGGDKLSLHLSAERRMLHMPRLQIRNLPMRTDLRPRLGFFASSGMILILLVFYRSDLRSTVVRFSIC